MEETVTLKNSNLFCYVLVFLFLIDVIDSAQPNTVLAVTDSLPHEITSPDFPKCCKPMQYILKKEVDKKYLKLLFTDLDIPPTSQLLIYGLEANGTKIPISAARYISGSWVRPTVLYEGKQMLIEFQSSSAETDRYTGFNGTFWADDDPWKFDKPLTFCPPIGGAIEGGKITLDYMKHPLDRQHYRLYCVWQLKPIPDSDLSIYVNVEKLSGVDSNIEVHNGITSSSPVIHSSSEVNSPLKLTSSDGFYIKLTRPVEDGDFTMTHGVFKSTSSSGNCSFRVDSKSVDGFGCGEGDAAICIPVENKCNAIHDCPQGQDELPELCKKSTTTVAPTDIPTTLAPCPRGRCKDGRCPGSYNERCPEESCRKYEKRCEGTLLCVDKVMVSCPGEECTHFESSCVDGSCVKLYKSCRDGSDPCSYNENRCKSGKCIPSYKRCPEDTCPSYKSFTCDGKCIYESNKCDGTRDCSSGIDERNCLIYGDIESKWGFLWVLIVVPLNPLFFIVCCCHLAISSRKKENPRNGASSEERQHINQSANSASAFTNASLNLQTRSHIIETAADQTENGSQPESNINPNPLLVLPPSYGDVMQNREVFVPPPSPPPPYSEADGPVGIDSEPVA